MGRADAREPSHWAFGGAPYGATKRLGGALRWNGRTHVDSATGAFGGFPDGATKCARRVPK
eukprot:5134552-Pyramimonas_sp.AAC.1